LRQARQTAGLFVRKLAKRRLDSPQIVADLKTLGVAPGGLLLVHSSLSALGYVPGGEGTVIDALQEVLGADGTLAMPTHSWAEMGKGCRTFDVRQTASCVGRITNDFHRLPGVVRSLHPTHSVAARGPLAHWLVAGHEQSETPCGEGTPYARVMDHGGQVLLLGVNFHVNTTFHGMEAMASVPYLLQDEPRTFTLIDAAGQSRSLPIVCHQPRIPRRFTDKEDELVREGIARRGKIGPATSLLAEAGPMRDFVVAKLLDDPDYLLAMPERQTSQT